MELIELTIGELDLKDIYLSMGTGGSDRSIKPEICDVIEQIRVYAVQLI
ncbi:hypothetical protein LPY66_00600 [Dehalobacter sp. DCM]|nr:hypothetical protein LPY66_00600 [Dehalobacter sp. DCM]